MIGCMLVFSQPMSTERTFVSFAALLAGAVGGVVLSALLD